MTYPVFHVPGLGGGGLIGLIATLHVLVSHFAIGGSLFLVAGERLALQSGSRELREAVRRQSLRFFPTVLVLGAVTGTATWWCIGMASPAATFTLLRVFLWAWAIEWLLFAVEVVAALVYYTSWERLAPATHLAVGIVYAGTAWLSLVVINAILTFMSTPGRWLASHQFADAFFNPGAMPSLLARTGIALALGGGYGLAVGGWPEDGVGRAMARRAPQWLLAGLALMAAGAAWYVVRLPGAPGAAGSALLMRLGVVCGALWLALVALAFLAASQLRHPRSRQRRLSTPLILLAVLGIVLVSATEYGREALRRPYLIYGVMTVGEGTGRPGGIDRSRRAQAGGVRRPPKVGRSFGVGDRAPGQVLTARPPGPGSLPLPAPGRLLAGLLVATFALHLIPVNFVLGGSALAAVCGIRGRTDANQREMARLLARALPACVAMAITLGIAPLLLLQVLYGRFFFASSILMGWPWLSVIGLLGAGYALSYRLGFPGRSGRWNGPGLVLLALLFLTIGFLFTRNMTLMLAPARWLAGGRVPATPGAAGSDPSVVPRFLHFVLAAVAVSGLGAAWLGRAQAQARPDFARWAEAHGTGWFTGATAAQFVIGLMFLGALPPRVGARFVGGNATDTALLVGGILAAVAALGLVRRSLGGASVAVACAIALMSGVRSEVRAAMLAPWHDPARAPAATSWGALAAFTLLAVVGAAVVAMMVLGWLEGGAATDYPGGTD